MLDFTKPTNAISSVYLKKRSEDVVWQLLVYKVYRIGDKIYPCGAPAFMAFHDMTHELNLTCLFDLSTVHQKIKNPQN